MKHELIPWITLLYEIHSLTNYFKGGKFRKYEKTSIRPNLPEKNPNH